MAKLELGKRCKGKPTIGSESRRVLYRGLPGVIDDGGRSAAGYRGQTGDCGVRALSIATGCGYEAAVEIVNRHAAQERPGSKRKRGRGRSSVDDGIYGATFRRIMSTLGWNWTATMRIGQGCRVHLREGELPAVGRLIANVSRHYVAVIDGHWRDTGDPCRFGSRCVYGYWTPPR